MSNIEYPLFHGSNPCRTATPSVETQPLTDEQACPGTELAQENLDSDGLMSKTKKNECFEELDYRGRVLARIYRIGSGRKARYRLAWTVGGKRQMKRFKTVEDARKAGTKMLPEIAKGSQVVQLSATQASDALTALEHLNSFRIATGRNVSLSVAVSEWVEASKRLGGAHTVPDAIDGFLKTVAVVKRVDLGTAMEDFVAEREAKTKPVKEGKRPALSPEHHYNTAIWLREFASTFPGNAVCDLQPEHMRRYMALHSGASPKTRNERRGVVKMFINWATERDYLPRQHRLLEGKVMENEDSTPEEIEVYTAEEFKRILERASKAPKDSEADYRRLFPVLALAGLAGLRFREVLRLEWSDVFHNGHIVITAMQAKTRSRRVIPMCDSLARWLEPYKDKQGKIWEASYDMLHIDFAALRDELKIKDRRNGLRHSYISAHFALYSDEGLTAKCAGNSPAMIHEHYNGLWSKSEGEQWFAVSPETPANVLPMPSRAKR